MRMRKVRARKRHQQLELLNKAGTTRGDTRIGKARGGRPLKGPRRAAGHRRRIRFKAYQPVHVVMRVLPEIGTLRQRLMYLAIRSASIVAARRTDARIVHISLQRTHIHLIVEAQDYRALAKLMQGFQISAAKLINRAHHKARKLDGRRRGRVFADRYHCEVITSPRQMRNALGYVLNNWRKHGEDRAARAPRVDPFSTGGQFDGWRDLRRGDAGTGDPPLIARAATTWLLKTGWRQYGLIGCSEVPAHV